MKNILIISVFLTFFQFYAQDNIHSYFDSAGVLGSITIYDYQKEQWYYSDSLDAQKSTLPASTFKIINSLIALDNEVIIDENEILKWDGKIHKFQNEPVEVWNQDTNLKGAFKNSTIWFYVEIAKCLGREKYKSILKECNYGNGDFTEKGVDFWNYGNFAITPQNQIEFLIRLYEENLPFTYKTIKTVKQIMITESTSEYCIRSKSGWTTKDAKDIGWWIGYIEKQEDIYFFATRLQKNEAKEIPEFGQLREKITRKILFDLEILN